ncbi:MAG: M14 family zinc carboxypeptidase, partial [Bdellovibrionota bacterium]
WTGFKSPSPLPSQPPAFVEPATQNGEAPQSQLKPPGGVNSFEREKLATWCKEVKKTLTNPFNWHMDPCAKIAWKIGGWSVQERPLVYQEMGDPASDNTTLVLTMVHGDENTPLYLGFRLIQWIRENPSLVEGAHIVIAPLVNPDGFLKTKRSRTNIRGVDTNRNFNTSDWSEKALASWKNRYKSDPRRFPGFEPSSEPETKFQEALIERFRPKKILSIHAPLNVTDYDGPSPLALERFREDYVSECIRLQKAMKAVSTGYFPGSLGNFAGQELGIPTVTLELPSADFRKAKGYWEKFQPGIHTMITFSVPSLPSPQPRSTGTE